MNQLDIFFGHATTEVYAQLRKRRAMLKHKSSLEKQQRTIAKRLRKNEKTNESQLRIARSRLRAGEIELEKRISEESKCWTAYQTLYAETDSVAKCFGMAFAQLVNNRPGIAAHVAKTKKLASDWQLAFTYLRTAEVEVAAISSTYLKLASDIESDRFAIRNLAAQITETTEQVNSVDNEVKRLIHKTAKHMSFPAIARLQARNSALEKAFFNDVRTLRRLLHRMDCLEQLAHKKLEKSDNMTVHESVTQTVKNSFKEFEKPVTFKIHLRGKGRVQNESRTFKTVDNEYRPSVNTRVVISESKRLTSSLPVRGFDTIGLGNQMTRSTLVQLNRAMLDATHQEVDNSLLRLSSEANLMTQRIAKLLFTHVSTQEER